MWKGTARDPAAYLRHLEAMDAIRAFAGDVPEKAVVEPQAQAVMERYDDFVTHDEVEK